MMDVLNPANKIDYTDGQEVEVMLDRNSAVIITGKVIGRGTAADSAIIDWWIVLLDKKIDGFPYSAITVPHTSIRPRGDNRPFLCEGVSRV